MLEIISTTSQTNKATQEPIVATISTDCSRLFTSVRTPFSLEDSSELSFAKLKER